MLNLNISFGASGKATRGSNGALHALLSLFGGLWVVFDIGQGTWGPCIAILNYYAIASVVTVGEPLLPPLDISCVAL